MQLYLKELNHLISIFNFNICFIYEIGYRKEKKMFKLLCNIVIRNLRKKKKKKRTQESLFSVREKIVYTIKKDVFSLNVYVTF